MHARPFSIGRIRPSTVLRPSSRRYRAHSRVADRRLVLTRGQNELISEAEKFVQSVIADEKSTTPQPPQSTLDLDTQRHAVIEQVWE